MNTSTGGLHSYGYRENFGMRMAIFSHPLEIISTFKNNEWLLYGIYWGFKFFRRILNF